MTSLHEYYVAELGLEFATPGTVVRHAIDCAMEPGTSLHENAFFQVYKTSGTLYIIYITV